MPSMLPHGGLQKCKAYLSRHLSYTTKFNLFREHLKIFALAAESLWPGTNLL